MAEKNLVFSWGANASLGTTIVDGKAYFATIASSTYLKNGEVAPTNEAYIYFDKDGKRYNVIAKRAIFDSLGNKIVDKYASSIESSGNTMNLYSPGKGSTAIDSAVIINSISNTWTAGTTAGPTLTTTVNGKAGTAVAIPSASSSASGIVTTGSQSFGGAKTFASTTDASVSGSTITAAVVVSGGLGIAKKLYVGSDATVVGNVLVNSSATINSNLFVGGSIKIANSAYVKYDTTNEYLYFTFD